MDNQFSSFAENILLQKYAIKGSDGKPVEHWPDIVRRVVYNVCDGLTSKGDASAIERCILDRKFIPGGRYLYAAGRPYHQVNNCFLYRAEDSREGWSDLLRKVSASLMSGGGVGIDYSSVREMGSPIRKTGGTASGPSALMAMVNEIGRHVMQGGSRRSAIWAGLNWKHPDAHDFITSKNWSRDVRSLKEKDFNFPGHLDYTNISVILDREFFDAYGDPRSKYHSTAQEVYRLTCDQMFKTSEPGFSINYDDPTESLRNACTEITSSDDSDVCNLGSINLARIESVQELADVTRLATKFLVCGTLYSDVPHEEVKITREKNRRLGLGLMGIHEFLLKRGLKYGEITPEVASFLETYKSVSDQESASFSSSLSISTPVKRRAIAPTGTIGIVAETTTGIEPIFCTAYKRRYLRGKRWHYEYVIDPTAKRLIDLGVPESSIEDALSLSATMEGFKRRIRFQGDIQNYVDHSISSTINIDSWGSRANSEENSGDRRAVLLEGLHSLRGITCYADGSRGGQPLSRVAFSDAVSHAGRVFEESVDVCDITGAGTCGS